MNQKKPQKLIIAVLINAIIAVPINAHALPMGSNLPGIFSEVDGLL